MKEKNKITIILVVSMVVVTMCTLAGFGMIRLFTLQYSDIPSAFGSLTTYGGILYDINQRVNGGESPLPFEPVPLTSNTSSSYEPLVYGKVIPAEEITKVCSMDQLFPSQEALYIPARDMAFLSPMKMYDAYSFDPTIDLNYESVKDQYYPNIEIIVNKKCKYQITNFEQSSTFSIVNAYYSFNEKRIYFLTHEFLPDGSKDNAKLSLVKYDPEKQVVESTSKFSLPMAYNNFLPYPYMDGDYGSAIAEPVFLLTDSMYEATSGKLYLSLGVRRTCISEDYKCYFENTENNLTKEGAENLSGVYEIEKGSIMAKKVYGSKLITADGILMKVDITALAEYNPKTQYDEFKIYFRDIREKITAK